MVAAHGTARSQTRVAQEQSQGEGKAAGGYRRRERAMEGGQNWAVHSTSGRADRSKVGGWTWGWQSRGSAGRRQGERGACAQGRRGLQWRTRHSKLGAGHETHTRQGKNGCFTTTDSQQTGKATKERWQSSEQCQKAPSRGGAEVQRWTTLMPVEARQLTGSGSSRTDAAGVQGGEEGERGGEGGGRRTVT